MSLGVAWVEHPQDTPVINCNVAALDARFAGQLGHREEFTLDIVRQWHTDIHAGCSHIPRQEYVGHFRGAPFGFVRDYNIRFGTQRFAGAPCDQVEPTMDDLAEELNGKLARWDAQISTAADATPSRLNNVLTGLAQVYASWIRIHPFADGNGRTARLLVNWVITRYWQPPILPGRPVADREGLVAATTPALMPPKYDHRQLVLELRRRLMEARRRAAATPPIPATPATPPGRTRAAGGGDVKAARTGVSGGRSTHPS